MKNFKLTIIKRISKPTNKPTKKKKTHGIGITKTEINKPEH
jgi:hypothetical protein